MMIKLLIISVTYVTPQNRVRDTITYVTLNAMKGVVLLHKPRFESH